MECNSNNNLTRDSMKKSNKKIWPVGIKKHPYQITSIIEIYNCSPNLFPRIDVKSEVFPNERRDVEVAMVVFGPGSVVEVELRVLHGQQVFGQKLFLEELIIQPYKLIKQKPHVPWSIRTLLSGPSYFLASSVASYSAPASTDPRYPLKALCPHGQWVGLQMGAKAEMLLNRPGFLNPKTSAPCPPIEWPNIPTRAGSILKLTETSL